MIGYLGCLFTHWFASWLVFLIELVMGLHMSCVAAHPRPHTHTGFLSLSSLSLSLSIYAGFRSLHVCAMLIYFNLVVSVPPRNSELTVSFVSVKCSPQSFQTNLPNTYNLEGNLPR